VKFHYELRDDAQSYGTGDMLAIMRKRLKTIDVRFADQTVRAYALMYTYSHASGASVLTSIQHFGRDATVSALGVVAQGATPPRPPITLQAAFLDRIRQPGPVRTTVGREGTTACSLENRPSKRGSSQILLLRPSAHDSCSAARP